MLFSPCQSNLRGKMFNLTKCSVKMHGTTNSFSRSLIIFAGGIAIYQFCNCRWTWRWWWVHVGTGIDSGVAIRPLSQGRMFWFKLMSFVGHNKFWLFLHPCMVQWKRSSSRRSFLSKRSSLLGLNHFLFSLLQTLSRQYIHDTTDNYFSVLHGRSMSEWYLTSSILQRHKEHLLVRKSGFRHHQRRTEGLKNTIENTWIIDVSCCEIHCVTRVVSAHKQSYYCIVMV